MLVFSLALSRLVPLCLGASALLVIGRYLHDRYVPASRALGRAIFAAVLVLGGVSATPYTLRSAALVRAEHAFFRGRYEEAQDAFALCQRLGGRPSPTIVHDWGVSLMNLGRFREAEEVILTASQRTSRGVAATPEQVLQLSICRYYRGSIEQAAAGFRAVEDQRSCLPDYFLGRIEDRRGAAALALQHYEESFRKSPGFFPAGYHLVRLHLGNGSHERARATYQELLRAGAPPPAEGRVLGQAVALEKPPPPIEFVMFQALH